MTDLDGTGSCAKIDALMRAVGLNGISASIVENTLDSDHDIDLNHFLPEIFANWNLSGDSMLFPRDYQGSKTSDLSSSLIVSAAEMQFDDETVVFIEGGIKSRLLNGRFFTDVVSSGGLRSNVTLQAKYNFKHRLSILAISDGTIKNSLIHCGK